MFEQFLQTCKKLNLPLYNDTNITLSRLNKLYDLNLSFRSKFDQWLRLQTFHDYDPEDKIHNLEHTIKFHELYIFLIQTVAKNCNHDTPRLSVMEHYKNYLKNAIRSENSVLSILLPNHYIYRDPYKSGNFDELDNIRSIQSNIDDLSNKLKNITIHEKPITSTYDPSNLNNNLESNDQKIYEDFLHSRISTAEQYKHTIMQQSIICLHCYNSIQSKFTSLNSTFKPIDDTRNLQRHIISTHIEELLTDLLDILHSYNPSSIDNTKKRPKYLT